jgi:hypothetical protein
MIFLTVLLFLFVGDIACYVLASESPWWGKLLFGGYVALFKYGRDKR